VRYAEKASGDAACRNPSYDVFAPVGTTYVVLAPGLRTSHVPALVATSTGTIGGPLAGEPCQGRHRPDRRRGDDVSDHVYRLSEVVGSSPTSVDEAIRNAIAKAAQTVRNIEWFQTEEIRGQVVDGDVAYFQVTLKFGFRME
jgi:dodecin